MKQVVVFLLCSLSLLSFGQKKTYLLVGAYTGGKSKGISVYRFNSRTGQASLVDTVATPNPSYLAVSPNKAFVYAVNELGKKEGGGKVTAFRFEPNIGHISLLNQTASMGEHPCYISIDKTGRWAVVGNYSSGTVTVLPVGKDGRLQEASDVVQHHGGGVNARQEGPHVHAAVLSANSEFVYVPDLGKDKLMIYALDRESGKLIPKDTTMTLQAGSGPRHFTFHPNGKWGYLVQELSGTVTMFQYKNGDLEAAQTISVLPQNFSKPFTSADIHVSPDGRFLYTSTRDEANVLTIFGINPSTGKLTLKGHQSVLGKTPRNFNFDPTGNFLLVANQNSDNIVVFKVNRKTGALIDTGNRIEVGNPVCVKWISK